MPSRKRDEDKRATTTKKTKTKSTAGQINCDHTTRKKARRMQKAEPILGESKNDNQHCDDHIEHHRIMRHKSELQQQQK